MDKTNRRLLILTFLVAFTALCFSLMAVLKEEEENKELLRPQPLEDITQSVPDILPEGNQMLAQALELPEKMEFAGEPVPLHLTDVRERLDRELHINTYWHSSTIFLLKRARRWLPTIGEILKRNNIPEDFKYIAVIESGLTNVISPADAVGFWQFLDGTGKEYGLEINRYVDERYDPVKATEAASMYLLDAYQKFGNWTNVAASYNRGMNGLKRAIEKQQQNDYYDLYLNEQTSRYMFRVLACKEIFENPEKYGFDLSAEHLYLPEEVKYVEVDETIEDLIQFSIDHGSNYKILRRLNPWLQDYKLSVKKDKTYKIALPAKSQP